MRMALISNGPSAEQFKYHQRDDWDVVVCVTGAAALYKCDWWCFTDWMTFSGCSPPEHQHCQYATVPIGTPKLWVNKYVPEKLQIYYPDHRKRFDDWPTSVRIAQEMLPDFFIDVQNWWCFSGCLALGLVRWMKPQECVVWGMDLSGTTGCRGEVNENDRSEHRWRDQEIPLARQLVAVCEKVGVKFDWRCKGGEVLSRQSGDNG